MQISRSSSNYFPFHRLPDDIPNGKRAIAIKWTDQEWKEIATAIRLSDSSLLEAAGQDQLKARHVFEAQGACLPHERQRKLISIAQDFSNKRDGILKLLTQEQEYPSPGGSAVREADNGSGTPGSSTPQEPPSSPLEQLSAVHEEHPQDCASAPKRPCTRNGLVILSRSSVDTVTWASEEWAAVAKAILDDAIAVLEGKADIELDAESIYAAQQVLPEQRRRDMASIQGRLVDDQARLRNIIDVLHISLPQAAGEERRPAGRVFRADGSGNGFTQVFPKEVANTCPAYRSAEEGDVPPIVGFTKKQSAFRIPFPVITDNRPAMRPELEEAIAEVFGPTPLTPATDADEPATMSMAELANEPAVDTSGQAQKRAFIRWKDMEWRQVADSLIALAGSRIDDDLRAFITPLAVHSAQSCLSEDRRRTIGSVYSGFASTQEKLFRIANEIAVSTAYASPQVGSVARPVDPHTDTGTAAPAFSAPATSISLTPSDDCDAAACSCVAESTAADTPVFDLNVSPQLEHGAIPAQQSADPFTEIARPFVRMLCEEICYAAVRHFLPTLAAHFQEKQ